MVVNTWLRDRGLEGFWPRALVMLPVATFASVAVSWAFHRLIERHFLAAPTKPAGRGRLAPARRHPEIFCRTSVIPCGNTAAL